MTAPVDPEGERDYDLEIKLQSAYATALANSRGEICGSVHIVLGENVIEYLKKFLIEKSPIPGPNTMWGFPIERSTIRPDAIVVQTSTIIN